MRIARTVAASAAAIGVGLGWGIQNAGSGDIGFAQMMQGNDALSVSVRVDNRPFGVLNYIGRNQQDVSFVEPDTKPYLSGWKGPGPMIYHKDIRFTDYDYVEFRPVLFTVMVRNHSPEPQKVQDAYLAVSSSDTDTQPLFYLDYPSTRSDAPCRAGIGDHEFHYATKFHFINVGWSDPTILQIKYAFLSPGAAQLAGALSPSAPVFTKSIRPNGSLYSLDIGEDLTQLKVQTSVLSASIRKAPNYYSQCEGSLEEPCELDAKDGFDCVGLSNAQCLEKLRRSSVLGGLSNAVEFNQSESKRSTTLLTSWMVGHVEYQWADAEGVSRTTSMPFKVQVYLGARRSSCRSGAGGGTPPDQDPASSGLVSFALGNRNYALRIPFAGVIKPGGVQQVRLLLHSQQSSRHRFKIAFRTSNGTTYTSKSIDLLALAPRVTEPHYVPRAGANVLTERSGIPEEVDGDVGD